MTFPAACGTCGPALDWAGLPAFLRAPLRLAAVEESPAAGAEAGDVRASLGGDGDAYERVVRRHQAKVFNWMRRFARDPGELEELVQDVFVEAYLSLRSYRFEAPFERWLRKVAVRAGYRRWKEHARERRGVPLEHAKLPVREVPDLTPAQAREMLHGLLDRLPPADRLVLTLLHLEELPVEEAAELTGWTKALVKVRAFRARRRLAAMMKETEERS